MNHRQSCLQPMPAHDNRVAVTSRRLPGNGRKPVKQKIYEKLVGPVTELCYRAVLNYFPENAAILDVGIGNGLMIQRFHELVKFKALKITGIDICAESLQQCARRVETYGLEEHIELHQAAIETFEPDSVPQYDYIFFSMSFMLLEDQEKVLKRVRRMIPREGEIVFFQTMYEKKLPIMNFIKPKLKYVSGIEFGPVSYEEDFFALLKARGIMVKEDRLLQKNWFQGQYRMIVTAPE